MMKWSRAKKHIAFRANARSIIRYSETFTWSFGLAVSLAFFFLTVPASIHADIGASAERPFLCSLFADHMVLQRDHPVTVWGWGKPGEEVTVDFNGQTKQTIVGQNGKWTVELSPMKACYEPHVLSVFCAGRQTISIHDVLVGDVWLCSGQSNMEFPLESVTNSRIELQAANHQNLRLFTTANVTPMTPQAVLPPGCSSWQVCSPETAKKFSAVGYFFGRDLETQLHVPIGLIDSCWGGTPIESWLSSGALRAVPGYAREVEDVKTDTVQCREDFSNNATAFVENWFAKKDPGSDGYKWASSKLNDTDWPMMTGMPERWNSAGLNHDGVVWYRRAVQLPSDWAGKPLTLSLGKIDFQDMTWFNGKPVGSQLVSWRNRIYHVPGQLVKAGGNTIAVRVYCDRKQGGFTGPAQDMGIALNGDQRISLSGHWRYCVGSSLKKLGRMPWRVGADPMVPTTLFNGKIAPLTPFTLRGVIWYQGEGNTSEPETYRALLTALIRDWRHRFACGDFPFGIVQLASFKQRSANPQTSGWAGVRQAQAQVAASVPNCGLAVTIDIGDPDDIHPKNKQEVGRRLALWALINVYGRNGEWSGPWYKAMRIEGNHVRVDFNHLGGGLVVRGDSLRGFAVAGANRKFVWADAFIDGDGVVVSSKQVPRPTAVRYAWGDNPDCNLFNKTGLPAVPFRTDHWPSNIKLGD